jgi:hypothetical protein
LIFVAAGIESLPRSRGLLVIMAWLVLTGISLERYYFDPEQGHADLRDAARVVAERETADDAILVPTVDHVFEYYYGGRSPVETAHRRDFVSDEAMWQRAQAVAPSARYLWYVEARPWFADPQSRFPAVLAQHYHQLSEFRVPGVRMLLFDRLSGAGGER